MAQGVRKKILLKPKKAVSDSSKLMVSFKLNYLNNNNNLKSP